MSRQVGSTHAWRGRRSKRSVGWWKFGFGFGGRCFDTSGCFLFRIPSSRFCGCRGFGLKLLRPCRLPGGGHFRLLRRLRDRMRRWIWIRGGVMVVALTRPLGRGSTPRPGPSARQRARPAELSERQGGMWLLSYRLVLAPALQAPPSLFSTSHSPGSSLCGYPRSHSTETVPAGWSTHRGGGSSHTRRTEAGIRSFAACDLSAGSACIAKGPLEPRTTPPTLAGHRVQ